MERTLEAGLARIFGTTPGAAPGAPAHLAHPAPPHPVHLAHRVHPAHLHQRTGAGAPGTEPLAAEALATYERAIAAQKAGDWAKYGEEIKRLGEILAKMK